MKPVLSKCPTCGGGRIKVVRSDYKTKMRGRIVIVPDLEREECPDCGEVLFDCAAMSVLRARRAKVRRVVRAGR